MPLFLTIGLLCAAQAPQQSYLLRTVKLLDACRADLPAMKLVAEQAADRLAEGGRLWAAGSPELVSEVCGRAGGLMMIRGLRGGRAASGDVVLFFPTDDRAAPPAAEGGCLVVSFGGNNGLPNHAREVGVSPTMGMAASAWLFTGELIAALTRLGKMPVIYETIGAYGGHPRMAEFKNGEIAFHEKHGVEAIPAGALGQAYIDTVSAMLRRVEKEHRRDLDKAGEWAGQARTSGGMLYMYSMGHMFPDEIGKTDIGKVFRSGVWEAGFRHPRPDDKLQARDFVVHIGYQHPPDDLLRLAHSAGARVVYVSLRADRDFAHDTNVIRIDPMWDWPDACVPVEGYDIPVLPASGIINGAIAWEIYRASQ